MLTEAARVSGKSDVQLALCLARVMYDFHTSSNSIKGEQSSGRRYEF
jgi:hypothetical protein